VPEWIALGREIDTAVARQQAAPASGKGSDPGLGAEVAALNCRIGSSDLPIPHTSLHKPQLKG
jgi:hypothetical protein